MFGKNVTDPKSGFCDLHIETINHFVSGGFNYNRKERKVLENRSVTSMENLQNIYSTLAGKMIDPTP